nr:hypothetical protein [Tanacetum cinerariifolium]
RGGGAQAPAESTDVASLTIDHVPSFVETELFETDGSTATPLPTLAHYSPTTITFTITTDHTSPTYAEAPLGYRAARIQLRVASPLPLPTQSTSRRADIPEADIPPQKRLCLTAPTPRFEVGENSVAAARQPGSIVARKVDYNFVETMDASIRASEMRTMDAIQVVNLRERVEAHQALDRFKAHNKALKARIAVLETQTSEAHNRALEAWIAVLETQAHCHEWQRQDAYDRATRHIMRIQALEDGACVDTLEETGSSS